MKSVKCTRTIRAKTRLPINELSSGEVSNENESSARGVQRWCLSLSGERLCWESAEKSNTNWAQKQDPTESEHNSLFYCTEVCRERIINGLLLKHFLTFSWTVQAPWDQGHILLLINNFFLLIMTLRNASRETRNVETERALFASCLFHHHITAELSANGQRRDCDRVNVPTVILWC